MKFFAAVKQALFAAKVFAAAGLDFEAVANAGDENALKAHVDAAVAAALAKGAGDHEKLFADAKAENDALAAKVAAHSSAFGALGFKLEEFVGEAGAIDEEKLKAAHDANVTKAARQMLAANGLPPIDEKPVADGTTPKKDANKLTKAQFDALTPHEKSSFCLKGGRITD